MIKTRFRSDIFNNRLTVADWPCLYANALYAKKHYGVMYYIHDIVNPIAEHRPHLPYRLFRDFIARKEERSSDVLDLNGLKEDERYLRLRNYEDNYFAAICSMFGSPHANVVNLMGSAGLISSIMKKDFNDFPSVIEHTACLSAAADYIIGTNVFILSAQENVNDDAYDSQMAEYNMLRDAFLMKYGVNVDQIYYLPRVVLKDNNIISNKEENENLQLWKLCYKSQIDPISIFSYVVGWFENEYLNIDELFHYHEIFDIKKIQNKDFFIFDTKDFFDWDKRVQQELVKEFKHMYSNKYISIPREDMDFEEETKRRRFSIVKMDSYFSDINK